MTFRAPVADIAFSLTAVAGLDRLMGEGGFPDLDAETMTAVLEAAGELAERVLAPLNRDGDRIGARLENGRVITPPGFPAAFRAFAQGGWNGLAADPEHGGQGLPRALHLAVFEMMHAANMAFALAPTLTAGAIEALSAHGTERQKALYLPRLISGDWSGTMNLTEPQAGSDLGLVRTRAEPDGAGHWRLTGQKIFITWGDHDCADNIVHLVLARLPDAPAGVRGISLFVAPARRVDETGALLEANAITVGGIEHKLGIHASPTCTLLFEGAHAELVGQPNQGLAHMFTMMNAARLNVGAQGVGIAERALQQADAYARERRQGRSPWSQDAPAPIWDHPDIRRRLVLTRAKIEAARAICLSAAVAADRAALAADPAVRESARLREELLTPIAKAWSTDLGVEAASEALQVHGGMGYIEETGAAQHYRDARIAPIYEGTNAIQALDLAGRKLGMGDGQAVRELLAEIRATPGLSPRLEAGVAACEAATAWMLERRGSPEALAGAVAYLKLMGDVVGGWMLAKGAAADPARAGLERLYAEHVLAGAPALVAAVQAGVGDLN
ncbi:MAG TPA: acyl-CoA dehydrogenase [Caulobacteraceae bacterium]|nr:acyl-CoA dehydrogenase [Caulobacteraceae bacterium]